MTDVFFLSDGKNSIYALISTKLEVTLQSFKRLTEYSSFPVDRLICFSYESHILQLNQAEPSRLYQSRLGQHLKQAPNALTPQGQLKNIKTQNEAAVETMAELQSPINKQTLPKGAGKLSCSLQLECTHSLLRNMNSYILK